MNRRELLGIVVGGTSFVWTAAGSAQQPKRLPIIGFLGVNLAMWAPWTEAFVSRLNALGWVDGKTAKLEFRWAQGRPDLHEQFADEFIKLGADVIWASGAALTAVMRATSTIPVVFVANDAVATGAVKTLARPGGNATGISLQALDSANKRYELLFEAVPAIRRLALMADANFAQSMFELQSIQALANKSGVATIPLEIRRTEDIRPALDRATAEGADALYVVINELLNANRLLIVDAARAAKLPSIYGTHDWVRSGGLMSYGPNFPALWARSADFVDRILRGAKPETIPVEQPTRFELVVSLKTARAIDLKVPETFLARADDVIE